MWIFCLRSEAAFTCSKVNVCVWLCGGVLAAGERPRGWLLRGAAGRFPGAEMDLPPARAEPLGDGDNLHKREKTCSCRRGRRERRNTPGHEGH